ncbi:Hypp1406 [Branchiostoma lanceolatum]|uniref:Hypp1406 protein n=1 Tax=Branchiostoma lanceolatum TaxID=7740 RepID=A0A8J9ZJH4_BRALA|nr:Hypp1406 [Branchiostoma lanceolatum]
MAKNSCMIWACVFFFVLAICSFITLIIFGPLYGIDSVAELRYRRTECTVTDSSSSVESCTYNTRCTQDGPHGGQSCEKRESTLLCLNVTVEYTIPTSSKTFTSQLSESIYGAQYGSKCTFNTGCPGSRRKVEEYEREWGTRNQRYPCFYDPSNRKNVIRTNNTTLDKWGLFHLFFWPSLLTVVGVIGTYVTCRALPGPLCGDKSDRKGDEGRSAGHHINPAHFKASP